jgi:hypothetical protein
MSAGKRVTVTLTSKEAEALWSLLAVILNDPYWFDDAREQSAVARVSDKLYTARTGVSE